jgi:hypothetical protein
VFFSKLPGSTEYNPAIAAKLLAREEASDATVFSGCDLVHVSGDGDRRVHTADVHSKN